MSGGSTVTCVCMCEVRQGVLTRIAACGRVPSCGQRAHLVPVLPQRLLKRLPLGHAQPCLLGLRHGRSVAPHEGLHREARVDQPRERVLGQPAACAQLLQLVHRSLVQHAAKAASHRLWLALTQDLLGEQYENGGQRIRGEKSSK